MHNVLARQARLEGSRLAAELPPTSRFGDADSSTDLSHDPSSSTSRAHRLISRYHQQQAEADARDSSSSSISPWADLPTRRVDRSPADQFRADVDAHRRRRLATLGTRNDNEPPMQFRHRAFRDPSFHAMFGFGTTRFRRRALGDYVRDEDFDGSYENLLTLGGLIGDAKPKATPEHVLAGLESASYKDWATAESDPRCPICLDDYQPSDPVMKLGDCRHWLHKECLEQWLKGASTCPVCRKDVKGKARRHHRHHYSGPEGSRRRDSDGPDGQGGAGPSGSGSGGNGTGGDTPMNWLNFLRD
ncbi:hypothetical protein C8F04DRAFT_590129 [Mycena alexandri]|uniref:RING-type domain-containing protein n=1 Tax=Mycena alexandri TaxID=1745969 RepID=A0AAD6XGL6_9AGAR|nr:hypothetical protein C8F04DRAFT_590129 [Mycena alexandri]